MTSDSSLRTVLPLHRSPSPAVLPAKRCGNLPLVLVLPSLRNALCDLKQGRSPRCARDDGKRTKSKTLRYAQSEEQQPRMTDYSSLRTVLPLHRSPSPAVLPAKRCGNLPLFVVLRSCATKGKAPHIEEGKRIERKHLQGEGRKADRHAALAMTEKEPKQEFSLRSECQAATSND